MKESEPMLETRLYRCGWIFCSSLCVWKIAKKVLFPHFVLSFGTRPCVFYTLTGYFCPDAAEPEVFGIAFRENFRECGGFSDDILCSSRICLVYDQPDDRPHQRTPASHRHEIP